MRRLLRILVGFSIAAAILFVLLESYPRLPFNFGAPKQATAPPSTPIGVTERVIENEQSGLAAPGTLHRRLTSTSLVARVISIDQKPVPKVELSYRTNVGSLMHTYSDDAGAFVFQEPIQYPVEIAARRNAYLPESRAVFTGRGSNTTIVIQVGVDIPIKVLGAKSRLREAELLPSDEPDQLRGLPISIRRVSSSEYVAEGVVDRRKYDLWIPPNDDGEFVLELGLAMEVSGVSARISIANDKVKGTLAKPSEVSRVDCSVILRKGLAFIYKRINDDGPFSIGPVPGGTWPSLARAMDLSETKWSWDGFLSTDSTTTVVLRKE